MTATCSVAQVLRGLPVGIGERAVCDRCNTVLIEGSTVGVTAYRPPDTERWRLVGLTCTDCMGEEIEKPTAGCEESLVTARLGITSDVTLQQVSLTLLEVEPLAYSPAEEGIDRSTQANHD